MLSLAFSPSNPLIVLPTELQSILPSTLAHSSTVVSGRRGVGNVIAEMVVGVKQSVAFRGIVKFASGVSYNKKMLNNYTNNSEKQKKSVRG